ncbi:MAG: hypothetical protein LIP05_11000 [Tannerellaceae bacterium]|nr:hypothetical protein [Tannerellaceae bacterium]
MKRHMIKQTYLIICILLGVWLTACQDYDETIYGPSVVDGNTIEVAIATSVPAITVQTKAAASTEEKQLQHVDILVFEVKDDDKEEFAYRTTHTNDLSTLDYTLDIYIKAKLKLSDNDEKYRIVFIANPKDEVDNILIDEEGTSWVGTEKEELLQKILFIQEAKWPTEEDNFRALPMWGEALETPTINSNTNSSSFDEINLLRSVARIELEVNINDNENGEIFKIETMRIYNARKEGLAAPFADHLNSIKDEVTAPSVADEVTLISSEIRYTVSDNKLTGVYVNEALNQKDGTQTDDPLFLVIGASYNQEPTSYYKIGFYAEDKPVDILRNFTYNMIITGVAGSGEEDEDKAAESDATNLTVAMLDWSDSNMEYVVFNGKYYLGVSEKNKTIPKGGGDYSLEIRTNYPDGWKATIPAGNDWLSISTPQSTSTGTEKIDPLSFTASANDTDAQREVDITIACETQLDLQVRITQVTEDGTSLKIQVKNANGEYVDLDNNTLNFHSGNHYEIEPYDVKITWTPASEDLIVDFDRSFEWDANTNLKTIYQGGEVDLKIAPARMLSRPENASDPLDAWFPSEETNINVQVGGDSSTKETIAIKKQHYEIYIDRAERYELDGEEHSFKIYSNSTNWTILFEDKGGIGELINGGVNPPITGGYNLGNDMSDSGQTITFTLAKPEKGSSINAEVILQVTYYDFGEPIPKSYVFRAYYEDEDSEYIAGGDANCYMLKPGGNKIHIPVSQANRSTMLGEQIKAGQKLLPCFIWTDHPGGYGVKSGQSEYTVANMVVLEDGPTAILEVTPGNAEGNAVVGITDEEGKILWSWHLWVSNFDPNNDESHRYRFRTYEFLDRNLGALTDDATNPKSFGLYYQWGRKDPFPSASASGSTSFVPIYDESGQPTQVTTLARGETGYGSGDHYLREATQEPLRFITSSEWWCTSDFGTYGSESTKFWSENETSDIANATKGIFDPCPDGWKTVPASTSNASDWYKLFASCTYDQNGHYSNVHNKTSDFVNLGNWPHVGAIGNNSATITDTQMGRYWTGNKSGEWDNTAIHFLFSTNSSASHPATSYSSSSGLPVRCMRRID